MSLMREAMKCPHREEIAALKARIAELKGGGT